MGDSFEPQKRRKSITSPSSIARPAHPIALVPSPSLQPPSLDKEAQLEHTDPFNHSLDRIPLFPPNQTVVPHVHARQQANYVMQQQPSSHVPMNSITTKSAQAEKWTPSNRSLAHIPLFPNPATLPPKKNYTGLPDRLKTGIEHLSGLPLDDVHVHYNSSKPAPLQALAYTQGTEIHVGPGQEHHLAHEAWHVVQQKQGRVKSTFQAKGANINDDEKLEREADRLGTLALTDTTGIDENYRSNSISGSHEVSHADQPVQRVIRLRVTGDRGPKIQIFGADQDAFEQLSNLVIFRWYLGQVTGVGKTTAEVKQALIHMQNDPNTWEFDVADQPKISAFLGEVDRNLGLAQPTWNMQTYLAERALYKEKSTSDIGTKPKKLSSKKLSATETETKAPKKSAEAKKPVDTGNVLGPFVMKSRQRPIPYTITGLTGTKIRDIFVSPEEKLQLDQLYQSAAETIGNEQRPTFKQLKQPVPNDIALAGVEIELKGMYIDVSQAPHIAAAAAIAGHKPIAELGNVELHIDAASGSGMALIEIVTKPLMLQTLVNTLALIKKNIANKETFNAWIETFKSSKEEKGVQAPKDLILDFILQNWKKVRYSRFPVHVQLTTSLTEKEFAGKIREHTIFPNIKRDSATLTEVLKSRTPKVRSSKPSEALIKHAYEQLPDVESAIPEDTPIDKVPFEYTTREREKATANLRTDANKLAPLITRNGDLAFLVEYRGGDSTTKQFINVIKTFLEKDDAKKADVEDAIKDAFPHLS